MTYLATGKQYETIHARNSWVQFMHCAWISPYCIIIWKPYTRSSSLISWRNIIMQLYQGFLDMVEDLIIKAMRIDLYRILTINMFNRNLHKIYTRYENNSSPQINKTLSTLAMGGDLFTVLKFLPLLESVLSNEVEVKGFNVWRLT